MRGGDRYRFGPASRCDSSPVISWPLIIRILNRFWIGRLNTTTGLKPRRE